MNSGNVYSLEAARRRRAGRLVDSLVAGLPTNEKQDIAVDEAIEALDDFLRQTAALDDFQEQQACMLTVTKRMRRLARLSGYEPEITETWQMLREHLFRSGGPGIIARAMGG